MTEIDHGQVPVTVDGKSEGKQQSRHTPAVEPLSPNKGLIFIPFDEDEQNQDEETDILQRPNVLRCNASPNNRSPG